MEVVPEDRQGHGRNEELVLGERNDLRFLKTVQAIPWFGENKGIARRLLACDNAQFVLERSVAKAKSVLDLNRYINKESDKKRRLLRDCQRALHFAGLPPVPD